MLKFGTSGVRGLVTEFTKDEVDLLTTAFLIHAENLGQISPVAYSMDLRPSSPGIQKDSVASAHTFGRDTLICGELPTPALALYAQKNKCLGVMITGSHIPADRNGIKFYLETGETLKADDQAIYQIYEQLKAGTLKRRPVGFGTSQDVRAEARALYIHRYLDFFPKNILQGFKLLFYQHSSVARDIFPEILKGLGAEVILLGRSETFIPVDTEAVEAVDKFAEWIKDHNADALVSTDGDADRPLFVNKLGQVIPGDKIGALASLFLGIEAIALPISCNSGISEVTAFKKVVSTKIGSPFVIEALNGLSQEFKSVAGFEANGGFILQSHVEAQGHRLAKLPTRDAVLPILSVLALAHKRQISLADVSQLLPPTYTASGLLKNFAVENSQRLLQKIAADPAEFFKQALPNEDLTFLGVNTLDGLRCSFEDSVIIHIRPSGNAPELRCYTEAKTQKQAEHLVRYLLPIVSIW